MIIAVVITSETVSHHLICAYIRPVWMTFLRYNFSVVAVFAVIYSKRVANGQLSLLKSYPKCPYIQI